MLYQLPAHRLLLRPTRPIVKLTDVRDDVTDTTAYTFTLVNIGPIRPRAAQAQTVGTDQVMRSPSNKGIFIVCHSEAAAITWTVSSCSLGGVNGTKFIDRGGGTNAINTAIFFWPAGVLQGITNTTVVVTHSKAVTACAIGVLSVENILHATTNPLGTTFNTSVSVGHSASGSCSLAQAGIGWTMIAGSTNDTGGGTTEARWQARPDSNNVPGSYQPLLLYEGSNAEISYSAVVLYSPDYNAHLTTGGYNLSWSAAGAFDSVGCSIL